MELDSDIDSQRRASILSQPSFHLPRTESPASILPPQRPGLKRAQLSHLDQRYPRLSLPNSRINPPSSPPIQSLRAGTLPAKFTNEGPEIVPPEEVVQLLSHEGFEKTLILDLRPSPSFTLSRIKGAINLCIPTTLLKRSSYNLHKLAETFTNTLEREKFLQWETATHIVVYDAGSAQLKDAVSCINTLKKFENEGWQGHSLILCGGFDTFSKLYPNFTDNTLNMEGESSGNNALSINAISTGIVAGGCPMPSSQTPANPFFGNIRQNMDLIGGVGQIPVKHPTALTARSMAAMPAWIRRVTDDKDQGKKIAQEFLEIEKAEQTRMQKALTGNVSYGLPEESSSQNIQIAGIEKGEKNRYKDMLPFDHSRVRLQEISPGGCDYVNASHIKAEWSNKHYIASQAPVPATFEDFWRLVWEQDARVIVMLTAESEGGQRKCHPYWLPNNYGQFRVKALSEKRVSLDPSNKLSPITKSQHLASPLERTDLGRRRSTNPHVLTESENLSTASPPTEIPHIIVRKLALSHSSYPFQPIREITQVQYSNWPDFGAPAHPAHVLGLIEHTGAVIRSYGGSAATDSDMPAKEGGRPIIVHCSAGCGRTGAFCTVDSVIDMLKRQKANASKPSKGDGLDREEWVGRDDIDLVVKAVEELRIQRLSMVQTLRQFVLCYETVMEWLLKEMPGKNRNEGVRRSYHG